MPGFLALFCMVGEDIFVPSPAGLLFGAMSMCHKEILEFYREPPMIPIVHFDAKNSIIHPINYVIIGVT